MKSSGAETAFVPIGSGNAGSAGGQAVRAAPGRGCRGHRGLHQGHRGSNATGDDSSKQVAFVMFHGVFFPFPSFSFFLFAAWWPSREEEKEESTSCWRFRLWTLVCSSLPLVTVTPHVTSACTEHKQNTRLNRRGRNHACTPVVIMHHPWLCA